MWWGRKFVKRRGPVPCDQPGRSCPKGHYTAQKTWCRINQKAYYHWRSCQAVGSFPDDETVRYNASILSEIERRIEGNRSREMAETMLALLRVL